MFKDLMFDVRETKETHLVTSCTSGARRSNRSGHTTHAILTRGTIGSLGTTLALPMQKNSKCVSLV